MLASELVVATPTGHGCRAEGPHGPNPCGPPLDVGTGAPLETGVCNCGCSLDEDCCDGCSLDADCCDTYFTWHATRLAGGVA